MGLRVGVTVVGADFVEGSRGGKSGKNRRYGMDDDTLRPELRQDLFSHLGIIVIVPEQHLEGDTGIDAAGGLLGCAHNGGEERHIIRRDRPVRVEQGSIEDARFQPSLQAPVKLSVPDS